MLLTAEQIQQLSGYKTKKYQIRWLSQNGIRYLIGADGHPRVLLDHMAFILGAVNRNTNVTRTRPNMDALDRFQQG